MVQVLRRLAELLPRGEHLRPLLRLRFVSALSWPLLGLWLAGLVLGMCPHRFGDRCIFYFRVLVKHYFGTEVLNQLRVLRRVLQHLDRFLRQRFWLHTLNELVVVIQELHIVRDYLLQLRQDLV